MPARFAVLATRRTMSSTHPRASRPRHRLLGRSCSLEGPTGAFGSCGTRIRRIGRDVGTVHLVASGHGRVQVRTARRRSCLIRPNSSRPTSFSRSSTRPVGRSARWPRARASRVAALPPDASCAARSICCGTMPELDIVSQAELVAAPLGSQPSYELLMSASAVAEVARHCTYEDAEDPFVFAITRAVLAQLPSLDAPHLDLIVAAYVFKLLSHIGYLPIAPPAWRARTRRQRISPRMRAACFARAAPRVWPVARHSSSANPLGSRALSP